MWLSRGRNWLICGSCTVSWAYFEKWIIAAGLVRSSRWTTELKFDPPWHIQTFADRFCRIAHERSLPSEFTGSALKDRRHPRGKRTLFELLEDFGTTSCADVRDRVYAMLSVATDYQSITVDYSMDRQELALRLLQLGEKENISRNAVLLVQVLGLNAAVLIESLWAWLSLWACLSLSVASVQCPANRSIAKHFAYHKLDSVLPIRVVRVSTSLYITLDPKKASSTEAQQLIRNTWSNEGISSNDMATSPPQRASATHSPYTGITSSETTGEERCIGEGGTIFQIAGVPGLLLWEKGAGLWYLIELWEDYCVRHLWPVDRRVFSPSRNPWASQRMVLVYGGSIWCTKAGLEFLCEWRLRYQQNDKIWSKPERKVFPKSQLGHVYLNERYLCVEHSSIGTFYHSNMPPNSQCSYIPTAAPEPPVGYLDERDPYRYRASPSNNAVQY